MITCYELIGLPIYFLIGVLIVFKLAPRDFRELVKESRIWFIILWPVLLMLIIVSALAIYFDDEDLDDY